MSLDFLTAYYNYANWDCESVPYFIDYYPEDTLSACSGLYESDCQYTDAFHSSQAHCGLYSFQENGLDTFGASSFTEVFIYSSPTCNDSTVTNLRQYLNGACYYSGWTDSFGGQSRMSAASASKSSFYILIYNDTECTSMFKNITFVADNSTCQESSLFLSGSYVKAGIVTGSSTTTGSGHSNQPASSTNGSETTASTIGVAVAIAIVVLLVLVLLTAVRRVWFTRHILAKATRTATAPPDSLPLAPIVQRSQLAANYGGRVGSRSDVNTDSQLEEQLPAYSEVG
ncbi:hypothetical protein HDU82_006686 [Entophlyctis luteolus]|nr:hypothetical protein HDU82_006686 [Entophlyctis luteolus]